jgi:hypothetical protein
MNTNTEPVFLWGFQDRNGFWILYPYEEQAHRLSRGNEIVKLRLEDAYRMSNESHVQAGLPPLSYQDFLEAIEAISQSFVHNIIWSDNDTTDNDTDHNV